MNVCAHGHMVGAKPETSAHGRVLQPGSSIQGSAKQVALAQLPQTSEVRINDLAAPPEAVDALHFGIAQSVQTRPGSVLL